MTKMFRLKLVAVIKWALFHGLLKRVTDQKKTTLSQDTEKWIKDLIINIVERLGNVTLSYKNLTVLFLFSVTKLPEYFYLSALLIKDLV